MGLAHLAAPTLAFWIHGGDLVKHLPKSQHRSIQNSIGIVWNICKRLEIRLIWLPYPSCSVIWKYSSLPIIHTVRLSMYVVKRKVHVIGKTELMKSIDLFCIFKVPQNAIHNNNKKDTTTKIFLYSTPISTFNALSKWHDSHLNVNSTIRTADRTTMMLAFMNMR